MDMEALRQGALNFSNGYQQAIDPNGYLQRKKLEADMAFQQQTRDRQAEQWKREDEQRAATRALAYDAENGAMVPGSDNSYDVAEGKRLGMQVAPTTQRTPMSNLDVEKRLGKLALQFDDVRGYQESLLRQENLQRKEQDKELGADMQKIMKGDAETLMKYATVLNNSGSLPGMLALDEKNQPTYVDPKTGRLSPMSFAEVASALAQFHTMGRGDWQQGMQMALQRQQYRDQRGDADKKHALDERQVGAVEMNAKTNAEEAKNRNAYQMGMLGVARDKLGIDRMESNAKTAAMNQMGKFGPMVNGVDAQGNAVPMVTIMGRDGSVSYQRVPLPEGVNFQRQVDPKIVDGIAANLEGKPTGRTVNGKREVYTPEMAYDAALKRVQNFSSGGAPSPVARDADATLKYLLSEADKLPKEKPKGGAMPGRKENTTQAERLRAMTLGGSR